MALFLTLSLTVRWSYAHPGAVPETAVLPGAAALVNRVSEKLHPMALSFEKSAGIDGRTFALSTTGSDPVRRSVVHTVSQIGRMKGVYSVIISRKGKRIAEEYFREGYREKPHNLKSASKSLLSALVGIAVEEGFFKLDQPIRELLPYGKIFKDPRKARITVRHLLTMTSGLVPTSYQTYNAWISKKDWVKAALDRPMVAEPGATFQYSTGNTHILSGILTAVTGVSTSVYAERKLFKPMGIQLKGWDTDPNGVPLGGNNLSLLPVDMVKLGQLYLDGGRFGSRQILPKWWVEETIRTTSLGDHDVYGDYGYLWYTRPGGTDAFTAVGFGGQYIYVSPPDNCVIVITSTLESKGRDWEKTLFDKIQNGILDGFRGGVGADTKPLTPSFTAVSDTRQALEMSAQSAPQPTSTGTTTANVVLRKSPGPDGTRLELVPLDSEVPIFETRNRWVRIRYKQKEGWIFGAYVNISEPVATLHEKDTGALQRAWTLARLNLRSGPGKTHAVVATLKSGSLLRVKNESGNWLKVQSKGLEGWLHSDYVKMAKPEKPVFSATVSSESVEIRSESPPVPVIETVAAATVAPPETPRRVPATTVEPPPPSSDSAIKALSARISVLQEGLASYQEAVKRWETLAQKLSEDSVTSRSLLLLLKENLASVETQGSTSALELASMVGKIESLSQSLENIQGQLVANSAESDTLRRDLTNFSPGFETLRNGLAAALHEISLLRMALKDAEKNRAQLKDDLEQQNETVAIQHALVTQSEKTRLMLTGEMAHAKAQILKMESALETASREREPLKANLAALQESVAALRDSAIAAAASREEFKKELTAAKAQRGTLDRSVQTAQAERNQLKADLEAQDRIIAQQQTALQQSDESRTAMSMELASIRNDVTEAGKAHDNVRKNLESVNVRITEIEPSLQTAQAEQNQLKADLEAQKRAIEEQKTGMSMELASIRTDVTETGKTHDSIRKDLESANNRIAGMVQSLQTVLGERDRLKAELEHQRQLIIGQRAEMEESEKRRAAMAQDLSAIRTEAAEAVKVRGIVKKDLESVNKRITGMAKSLEAALVERDQLRTELKRQDQVIAGQQAGMEASEKARAAMVEELAAIRSDASVAGKTRDTVKKDLQSVNDRVTGMVQSLQTAQAKRDQLRAGLESQNRAINRQQAGIEQSEKARSALVEELAAVRSEAAESGKTREILKKDLESFNARVTGLGQSLKTSQTERNQLKAKLEDQNQILAGQQAGMEKAGKERSVLVKDLALLRKETTAAAATINNLQKEMAATTAGKTPLAESVKVLWSDKEQLKAELKRQDEEIAIQRAVAIQSEKERSALTEDLAAAHVLIRKMESAAEKAVKDRETSRKAFNTLRQEVAGLGQKKADMAIVQLTLEKERALSGEGLTALKQSFQNLQNDRKKLTAELARQADLIAKQQGLLDQSEKSRAALVKDLAVSRNLLKNLDQADKKTLLENDAFNKKLEAFQGEIATLNKEATKASASREVMIKDLAAAKTGRTSLENAIQSMKLERKRLKTELARQQEEIAAQGVLVTVSEKERTTLRKQLAAALEQIDNLKTNLQVKEREQANLSHSLNMLRQQMASTRKVPPAKMPPVSKPAKRKSVVKRQPDKAPVPIPIKAPPVAGFVESWAKAWARQDADAYLSHYSKKFKPKGGRSLASWRRLRRKRLAKPAYIQLSVKNLSHIMQSPRKATASFVQHYRSNTFVDSVTKTLVLVQEDGGWKIFRENTP